MVFVAGPRQVGKATLARSLPDGDRGRIPRGELPPSPLWVFDEIHKFRRWRGFLKGLHDAATPRQRILVTGSARPELYRHGGDSLQGR